jgi:hypothetical protein
VRAGHRYRAKVLIIAPRDDPVDIHYLLSNENNVTILATVSRIPEKLQPAGSMNK